MKKQVLKASVLILGVATLFTLNSFAAEASSASSISAQVSCSIRMLGQRAVQTADISRGNGDVVYTPVSVELQGFKCEAQADSASWGDVPGNISSMTFTGPKQGQSVSLKPEDRGVNSSQTIIIDDVTLNGRIYCSCAVY